MASFITEKLGFLRSFNKQFWVVNALELFERGSYYGFMAVFMYHAVYNLGIDSTVAGLLLTLLMPLLYFVPLIASALAEKYGYKSVLVAAFGTLAIAYFSLSLTLPLWALTLTIIALGIGAGAFKPIISATIAHITSEENRNYGYAIYYWMINLGASLVPLTIGILIPQELYRYVFLMSTGLITLNLIISLTLFKDPVKKNPDKNIMEALGMLGVVMKDRKFALILLIYSGFWFMFAVNHSFLPLYMVDFKVMPAWFTVPLLATINPFTIVVIGLFLPKLYSHIDTKKLMVLGMFIFIFGLFIVGTTGSRAVFVMGIIIFSVGEFITHPSFISYVSKLAPKDKVAIYMGFSFLPAAIGLTLGILVSSFLYPVWAETAFRPAVFWGLICSEGLVCLALFILYNLYYHRKECKEREEAGEEIDEDVCEALGTKERIANRLFETPILAILCIALIPVFMTISFSLGTDEYFRGADEGVDMNLENWIPTSVDFTLAGELSEGSDRSLSLVQNETHRIIGVSALLSCTDEAPANFMTNEPDTFSLDIALNGTVMKGDSGANAQGGAGQVSVSYDILQTDACPDTPWEITLRLVEAGDQIGRFGVLGSTDGGNSYSMKYTVTFIDPPAVEESDDTPVGGH